MFAPRAASSSVLVVAEGQRASRFKVDTDTLWSLAHGVGFLVVAMAMVLGDMLAGFVKAARQPASGRIWDKKSSLFLRHGELTGWRFLPLSRL